MPLKTWKQVQSLPRKGNSSCKNIIWCIDHQDWYIRFSAQLTLLPNPQNPVLQCFSNSQTPQKCPPVGSSTPRRDTFPGPTRLKKIAAINATKKIIARQCSPSFSEYSASVLDCGPFTCVSVSFCLSSVYRFWATVCKTVCPMPSNRCLSVCPVCDVGVLSPNGWMDQGQTWHGGRPRPGHIVLDGDPAPPHQKEYSPIPVFGPCLLKPYGWIDQDATW